MTPSILLRTLIRSSVNSHILASSIRRPVKPFDFFNDHQSVRFAGHAKWQNIKHTKQAGDLAKGKLHSRYVLLVRRAVIAGGMNGNPKINPKLGQVLTEAAKLNIPKAILERAIERALNVKMKMINVEIQGPGGCSIIAKCETDNPGLLRRDIKKAIKKYDASVLPDNTITTMFRSQGFVRADVINKDGKEIDDELAEEAAIIANAQEVNMESFETDNGQLSKVWVFTTDADTLDPCRGELEKLGLKIISSESELVAYRGIDFGPEIDEQVGELVNIVRDLDQVLDVYHNLKTPREAEEAGANSN